MATEKRTAHNVLIEPSLWAQIETTAKRLGLDRQSFIRRALVVALSKANHVLASEEELND